VTDTVLGCCRLWTGLGAAGNLGRRFAYRTRRDRLGPAIRATPAVSSGRYPCLPSAGKVLAPRVRVSGTAVDRQREVSGSVRLVGVAVVPGPIAGEFGQVQQWRDGRVRAARGSRRGQRMRSSVCGGAGGPLPGPGASGNGPGPRRAGGRPWPVRQRPGRRAAGLRAARRPPRPGPPGSRPARP
jgi:hypothetical protein